MATLLETRDAKYKAATDIVAAAKSASRDLTPDEIETVEDLNAELVTLNEQITQARKSKSLIDQFATVNPDEPTPDPTQTKSLGEHFVKSVGGSNLGKLRQAGTVLSAPEWKAVGPMLVGTAFDDDLVQLDRTIVQAYRRPTVSDLLGAGTISGTAVTYYIEGPVTGNFAAVAEGATKPQLQIANPTPVTDRITKIAGWWTMTDEMVEDVPWFIAEVNNRGLYLLSLQEEYQLLNGDGTGANLRGVLQRSGLQTETQAATGDSAADAIFRALTKVQTATGLTADGIIINPADYQALRLAKDSNGQYFGGGFFAGQYGQGGIPLQPPIWGYQTVVSAAVPAKTVVLGALRAATTVYRKGGIRVESTNTHVDDFTANRVTTRIEERIGLAVRIPAAIVKVTLV